MCNFSDSVVIIDSHFVFYVGHLGMTETCTAVTMWPITQRRGISGSKEFLICGNF